MTKQKEKPTLILELEKQLGFPLKELPLHKIYDEEKGRFIKERIGSNYMQRGYSTNEKGQIIALSLDYIPETIYDQAIISELELLENLSLRGVGGNIKVLIALKKIKRIDLSASNIKNLTFLQELKGLTSLDLRGNKITDIALLKGLTSLTILNLNNNQISDISILESLTGLNKLGLSDNQITENLPK